MTTPRSNHRHSAAGALVTLIAAGAAAGPTGGARPTPRMDELVRPRLIAERTALVRGQDATLGVTFDILNGWHLYWQNPGDSGGPIQIELQLPPGVTAGPVQWPTPHRSTHSGMVDFTYVGAATLLVPIHVSQDFGADRASIVAKLRWVVCSDICLFGDRQVEVQLPVIDAGGNDDAPGADRARIDEARARLPRPLAQSDGVSVAWEGATLVVDAPGAEAMVYFPGKPLDVPPVDILEDGQTGGSQIRIRYSTNIEGARRVEGVLELKRNGATTFHQIDIAGPKAG